MNHLKNILNKILYSLIIFLFSFCELNAQEDSAKINNKSNFIQFFGGNAMIGSFVSPLGYIGLQMAVSSKYFEFDFGLGRYNGKKYELGLSVHSDINKVFVPGFNVSWSSTEKKGYKMKDPNQIDIYYDVGRAQHLNYSFTLFITPKKWRKENSSFGFYLRTGYRDRISSIKIEAQDGYIINQDHYNEFNEALFQNQFYWNFGIRFYQL